MAKFQQFTHDAARPPYFGVLAVYAGASYLVLEAVGLFVEQIGLPDWVFPSALVLLVLGLPGVIATALAQGLGGAAAGTTPAQSASGGAESPSLRRRLLTWRKLLSAVYSRLPFSARRAIEALSTDR